MYKVFIEGCFIGEFDNLSHCYKYIPSLVSCDWYISKYGKIMDMSFRAQSIKNSNQRAQALLSLL